MAIRLEIKERKANGKSSWCIDLRPLGEGRNFFKVKADAERFLNEKRRELGLGWADLTDAQRIEFVSGQHRLAAVGATVTEAIEFFLKHRGSREAMAMSQALSELIKDRTESGKRPKYIKKLQWSLKPLRDAHAESPVSSITRADVEAWLNGNGWAAGTRKYVLNDVRTFFAFARQRGWCNLDPSEGIGTPTVEDKPPEILNVKDCRQFMATAKQHKKLLAYCTLALFCGIRPEEIKRMSWPLVRITEKHVEVPAMASKTRQRRIVQLQPNAIALLSICKKKKGPIIPANFRKLFEAMREKSKVKWSHDCLRHSFASYHLAAFGSADKTATEMGHRNTHMLFKHYRELVRPADAKAFWKIS